MSVFRCMWDLNAKKSCKGSRTLLISTSKPMVCCVLMFFTWLQNILKSEKHKLQYLHLYILACALFLCKKNSWWLCDVLWVCWSTFVRFSNYSLLSLSLFSGVALKRAFGFVGSACGHKSKREEKRKLHWTCERCCICLCETFYINDYVGYLIIFLFFDHLFNVFTIHFWWLYLLHNMQLI